MKTKKVMYAIENPKGKIVYDIGSPYKKRLLNKFKLLSKQKNWTEAKYKGYKIVKFVA